MASQIIIFSIAISFAVLLQCGVEADSYNQSGGSGDSGNGLSIGYINGGGDETTPTPDADDGQGPLSFGTDMDSANYRNAPNAISAAADTIQNAISNAASVGENGLSGGANNVADVIGLFGTELTDAFKNAGKVGGNGIGVAADRVAATFVNAANEITNAIKGTGYEPRQNLYQGGFDEVVNAIGSAAADVRGTIYRAADKILQGINEGADDVVYGLRPLNDRFGDDDFHRYPPYNLNGNRQVIQTIDGIGAQILNEIDAAANKVVAAVDRNPAPVPPPAPVPAPAPAPAPAPVPASPETPVPVQVATPADAPAPAEIDPGFNGAVEYIPVEPSFYNKEYVGVDPGFNVQPQQPHIIPL